MDFLYFLESIRIPGLNEAMLLITRLGEEFAFLLVAITFFWCVDKYKGYYMLSVGFLGNITSQFMKIWFRVPRPWVLDENFTILEQAREAASGYSFPSGHSQCAVGVFGSVANVTRKRWLKWVCVAVCVLVPFSRMYLGVHTPKDVLVGALISLLLVFTLKPLIVDRHKKVIPILLPCMLLLAVAYVCFLKLYTFPEDVDGAMLDHATENAFTYLGCLAGMSISCLLDEKWIKFPTRAVWWVQVIKVVVGGATVMAVKVLLKTPLNDLLGLYWGRASRYFLMVVIAGTLWPLTFRFLSRIGKKNLE